MRPHEHIWTVVCEKVITDRDSNNVSLDVIEQLTVSPIEIPEGYDKVVIPQVLIVATLWHREPSDPPKLGRARIRLGFPDGTKLNLGELQVDVHTFRRARSLMKLPGLPLKGAGIYRFFVDVPNEGDWITVASVPVEITEALFSA